MSTALTVIPGGQLPAHLLPFQEQGNISGQGTTPTLSFEGSVFQISVAGEKIRLVKFDPNDEEAGETPLNLIRVVVVGAAARRGRAYYAGAYDPSKVSSPLCWSNDGVLPEAVVSEKQSTACASCPQAVKGSRIGDTNGKSAACAEHRMLAVLPIALNRNLVPFDVPVLRMRIGVTSDWDKNNAEAAAKNWYAWNNYTDYLTKMRLGHTAMVVTKVKFDKSKPYPKLLFQAERTLEAAEVADILPLISDEDVLGMLRTTYTPKKPDAVEETALGAGEALEAVPENASDDDDDEDEAPAPAPVVAPKKKAAPVVAAPAVAPAPVRTPAKVAQTAAGAAAAAPVVAPVKAAAKPAPQPVVPLKAAPKAPVKAAAPIIDMSGDDDDEDDDAPVAVVAPVVAPVKKKAPLAATPVPAATPGLESVLKGWDDEDATDEE